ncbi:MAG: YbaB/EbfC family nucleoid-associated protein [Candidatus Bipolaricaulota bacterium]
MKGFGNINKIMEKAQEMQDQIEEKKEKLEQQRVEATAGGGMVKVVANGNDKIVDIQIDEEVVDPDDVEMLEDLIVAAINEAQEKVQELAKEELGGLAGGLDLPNIPGL